MNTHFLNNLIEEASELLKPENRATLCKDDNAGRQLIKVLTELSDKIIVYRDDIVLCRYQYLLPWRMYTMNLEGDLLVTVFLANYSIRSAKLINRFDWKLVIDHDNKILNSILSQGMADNHYHLGGSLPIFQCFWIEIMENEVYRNNVLSSFLDVNGYLNKATRIRKHLVEFLFRQSGIVLKSNRSKGLETYYEERKFLYHIIRELMQNDLAEASLLNLLYDYLIIKEWFRRLIVQCRDHVGERAFFSAKSNKDILLKWCNNPEEIIKSGIGEQIRSNYIKRLEIRVKMQNSPLALYEYINWLERQIHSLDVDVRYIICFSRKEITQSNWQYRNQPKVEEMRKQIEDLNTFLTVYHSLAKQIIGLDVCSKESNYKPEVFSEIMIRNDKRLDCRLKRMYHVGEKYSDILSGLRTIDECICFYGLKEGDRLGHAVPAFEKIDEWYNERGNRITISKEEYLDNMAWLYCNLSKEIEEGDAGNKILEEFQRFFYDLYGGILQTNPMCCFYCNPSVKVKFSDISIFHYFEAWKLRKEDPEKIKRGLAKNIGCDKMIEYYIAYCYFYCADIKYNGCQKITINITPEFLRLIQIMQNIVQDKIRNQGICVEVCPSSNILMDTVKKSFYHPIISLFERAKSSPEQSDICISVNTDDQGIFSTSLMSEYSLLANAFENNIDNNANIDHNRDCLYKWINKVRENGIHMCDLSYD